ncbi:VanZ family protein [bacterium]|nr:VanZ family protein [bacterium]
MVFYLKACLIPNLRLALFLTIIFTIVICCGTLTPLPKSLDVPGSDKWHHFVAFSFLVYPLTVANKKCWIPIILFGLFFGALIELVQPYLNRFGDIQDFQADAIGVLIGFALGVIVYSFRASVLRNI